AILTGRLAKPGAILLATVAAKENIRSPGVASPFVPSSNNGCTAEPPIFVRSAMTVSPVLAGFAPGVTLTVNSVAPPACTVLGFAAPTPDGGVGTSTVSEIEALPDLPSPSVIVVGRFFNPPAVPGATVAWKEKTLSPAVA